MADKSGHHRVQITPVGSAENGATTAAAAPPVKLLNCFVHFVALVERTGNALGTLAFTWATVVLLGGYATLLDDTDFGCATALVALEAARMFTRDNNKLDYQFFFRTRGAFRPLGWNGLIVILCLADVQQLVHNYLHVQTTILSFMAILVLVTGQLLCRGSIKLICGPFRRAISLWGPLVAILLLAPCLRGTTTPVPNQLVARIIFALLIVTVSVLTISRLQFPKIVRLVNHPIGQKLLYWRPLILPLCMCMCAATLIMVSSPSTNQILTATFMVVGVVIVSFGNFQFPAAVTRAVIALVQIIGNNSRPNISPWNCTGNLAPSPSASESACQAHQLSSLNVFYGMVLGQGILYIVACVLEFFSFIPRRRLVHRVGFKGQWGEKSVKLYYAYAFKKCMEGDILSPKNTSLTTFAMDSINSDSPMRQFYGVQMLHSYPQGAPAKAQLLSELTASTKTMTALISMLGLTSANDKTIRLSAAKVTAEVANSLRVAAMPGTMQLISTLLDNNSQVEKQDPLLDSDDEPVGMDEQNPPRHTRWQQMKLCWSIPEGPSTDQDPSTQQVGMDEQDTWILGCWQRMTRCGSIAEEESMTDPDLLPVLGMLILERLAKSDHDNCVEISRATDLISKIIGFTSYRSDTMNTNDTQQKVLVSSSLKLLRRLTSTGGEIGIKLRQKISEHPFLLSNLADVLEDSGSVSNQELSKLTVEILRNLALDEKTRQEIGSIQVITSRLVQAFHNRDEPPSTNYPRSLQKVAGQALVMLTTESAHNCSTMLKESEYEFIKHLKTMLDGPYKHVAARLLRNLCAHARHMLSDSDLMELSYALREVLKSVMDAEGRELEVLIGLSSQICNVIPKYFAQELKDGQIDEPIFVKKLVNALNANMKPTAQCPGIRRVILEQAIFMMEQNSHCVNHFRGCRMMEALSKIQKTPSKAEKYRLFLGNAGLMEYRLPLSSLVARAKDLMTSIST